MTGQIEFYAPHFLAGVRRGQKLVVRQRRQDGRVAREAFRRGHPQTLTTQFSNGLDDRGCTIAYRVQQVRGPRCDERAIGGLAVHSAQQWTGTQLVQPGVERLGVPAEVGVCAVAESQDGITHVVQGFCVARQGSPEACAVVGWPALAETAGDHHRGVDTNQVGRIALVHRGDGGRDSRRVQEPVHRHGRGLGVSGLRRPQDRDVPQRFFLLLGHRIGLGPPGGPQGDGAHLELGLQ